MNGTIAENARYNTFLEHWKGSEHLQLLSVI